MQAFRRKMSEEVVCTVLRFLGMQHPYFYSKSDSCPLCHDPHPPDMSHVLVECPATTEVCEKHGAPDCKLFLR